MKSIRGKFLLTSMIGILLCAVAMGYAGTWSISKMQTTSSEQVIAPELTERDAPIRRCMPISAD